MKRALILVAVLLLSSTLSWAQTAGTAPAPDPRTGGGHCQLPNLAGLTPEQRAIAALNAAATSWTETGSKRAAPRPSAATICGSGRMCTERTGFSQPSGSAADAARTVTSRRRLIWRDSVRDIPN